MVFVIVGLALIVICLLLAFVEGVCGRETLEEFWYDTWDHFKWMYKLYIIFALMRVTYLLASGKSFLS